MVYTTNYETPLCEVLIASDGESIVGLWMDGQKYYGATMKGDAVPKDDLPVFQAARDWLSRYFDGGKPDISELPLAPFGGEFRQEVWAVLRGIPYGETLTYGDIARALAAKTGKTHMSAQAVGGAVGHNPISIIIPCHRVVGTNGSLTGYAGGIDKKVKLLEHEGTDLSRLFVPAT